MLAPNRIIPTKSPSHPLRGVRWLRRRFNTFWTQAHHDYRGMLRREPCSYCGGRGGYIDHIVPRARGGGFFWDNFTPACLKCNSYKGDTAMLMYLVRRGGYGASDSKNTVRRAA